MARVQYGPQLVFGSDGQLAKSQSGGVVTSDEAQSVGVSDIASTPTGSAMGTASSDAAGVCTFWGPDSYAGELWVDFGAGPLLMMPLHLMSDMAEAYAAGSLGGGGGSSVPADNSVSTSKVQDGAITAAKLAEAVVSSISAATTAASSASTAASAASSAASTAATDAASALAAARSPITFVATAEASAGAKALANGRVLPASGAAGLATALKGYLEGADRLILLKGSESYLELDAQLTVTPRDKAELDLAQLPLMVHAAEANGGNSGNAGIVIGGSIGTTVSSPGSVASGLQATIYRASSVITHTSTALASAMTAGTWFMLTTTTNRNPNRPLEYFEGEIGQTLSATSTSWTWRTAARAQYTTSAATIRTVNMVEGVKIRGLIVIDNPAATTRQNGVVLKHLVNADVEAAAEGERLADGVGVWGCVGGRVHGWSRDCQDRYAGGTQGYGLRDAGSEGLTISWDDEGSRHGVDLGQSSSSWPVTRNTFIEKAHARHTYAAGFAIHDAEHVSTASGAIWSLNCGGGLISRGSFVKLLRPIIIGGHADNYPWRTDGTPGATSGQATTAGCSFGERTKLNLTAFDDTSANGFAGRGLELIEPFIDVSAATGDYDGILIEDPLQGATIVVTAQPIRPRRVGLRFIGDSIADSTIRVIVDHTTGSGSTGSYGPPTGTTYTGVTLTGATGVFDLGSGTPPAVGTMLISTGGTPASATPAGWGGFVCGAVYYVYSVSGTTFTVASRKSGNTAAITFTQNLTGLSFLGTTGQLVHSAYLVPSVSSVNPQFIARSSISITSTGCRATPVVIGGARNGGVSVDNSLSVTVTSLGSGPTASTPVVQWVGTSCGDWQMPPVAARVSNRAALHAAYTGVATSSGGPAITYLPGRSVFADCATDLHLARTRGPRPASGQWVTADHAGLGTNTTLVASDKSVTRLFRLRVTDSLIDAVGTATAGSAPVLGAGGTYLRLRVGAYADGGTGNAPALSVAPLATLGDIDLTGAVGQKLATLATALQDGSFDPSGSGYWWISATLQYDGADPTTFPTVLVLATLLPLFGPTDLASPTVRAWTAGNSMSGALAALTSINRDGTARVLTAARAL